MNSHMCVIALLTLPSPWWWHMQYNVFFCAQIIGWTALHIASFAGQAAAVALLLDYGADVHAVDEVGGHDVLLHGGMSGVNYVLYTRDTCICPLLIHVHSTRELLSMWPVTMVLCSCCWTGERTLTLWIM